MAEKEEMVLPECLESIVPSLPAVTSQEKHLASQALSEFERGAYGPCLAALQKLQETRQSDPKVSHNLILTKYCQSSYTRTDEFRKEMEVVCSQSRVAVSLDNVDSLDDVDQCVIYYNQAVILYYLRQYNRALYIADKLFQFIEPMEEGLSRKVMLLLVELYICTHQPDKAMGMLSYLEKTLFGNGGGGKHSADKELRDNQTAESPSLGLSHSHPQSLTETQTEGGEGTSKAKAQQNEVYRPQISQYKVRCFIMLKSMKSCKREMKTLMTSQTQTLPSIYLKSDFEYLRGNPKKAMKLLNGTVNEKLAESTDSMATLYYNNLGCIHFQLKKHHLAAFYSRKALAENESATKEVFKQKTFSDKNLSGYCLQTIAVSRHLELLYNMGLQLLHCGKALQSFDCLIEVVQTCQINPRLWLRLAECCIMVHKETNDMDRHLEQRSNIIQGSVGSGIHRKLILGQGTQSYKQSCDSGAMPAATLEFASLCLRNALMLLPDDSPNTLTSDDPHTDTRPDPGKPQYDTVIVAAPPGNPLRGPEVQNLRCSILACSAYVSLCLGDYVTALKHANTLIGQKRISPAHKYLAHMYQAESLLAADKIADAVQHLNVENVPDINTLPPEVRLDQDKTSDRDSNEGTDCRGALYPWSPKDLTKAHAIMHYNVAVCHAVRGEFDKAMVYLSKSTQSIGVPLPAQVYYLRLYLDLLEGRRKYAQGIIKEHFGHVTPNRI